MKLGFDVKTWLISAIMTVSLGLAACGTTQTKTTTNIFQPAENGLTLLVKPDVELKVLMASGLAETRADWSKDGEANLANALEAALRAKGGKVQPMDLSSGLTAKQIQMIKLNDAVIATSFQYDYQGYNLPTKEGAFDRSIGPGAAALAGNSGADYALMVTARGSYSSGGKVAMNIAMAALGGPVQVGGQQAFASLVDLKSGDILWTNLATAATGEDMRKPDGADSLVERLLKDFPI